MRSAATQRMHSAPPAARGHGAAGMTKAKCHARASCGAGLSTFSLPAHVCMHATRPSSEQCIVHVLSYPPPTHTQTALARSPAASASPPPRSAQTCAPATWRARPSAPAPESRSTRAAHRQACMGKHACAHTQAASAIQPVAVTRTPRRMEQGSRKEGREGAGCMRLHMEVPASSAACMHAWAAGLLIHCIDVITHPPACRPPVAPQVWMLSVHAARVVLTRSCDWTHGHGCMHAWGRGQEPPYAPSEPSHPPGWRWGPPSPQAVAMRLGWASPACM